MTNFNGFYGKEAYFSATISRVCFCCMTYWFTLLVSAYGSDPDLIKS